MKLYQTVIWTTKIVQYCYVMSYAHILCQWVFGHFSPSISNSASIPHPHGPNFKMTFTFLRTPLLPSWGLPSDIASERGSLECPWSITDKILPYVQQAMFIRPCTLGPPLTFIFYKYSKYWGTAKEIWTIAWSKNSTVLFLV